MTKIHFVCRANVWRSRLAEAYAKSLFDGTENISFSSSGIAAADNWEGDISAHSKSVLEKEGLWQHSKPKWTQTTQAMIESADQVVFLDRDVFEDGRKLFVIPTDKTIIWNIPGRSDVVEQIKENVRKLVLTTPA